MHRTSPLHRLIAARLTGLTRTRTSRRPLAGVVVTAVSGDTVVGDGVIVKVGFGVTVAMVFSEGRPGVSVRVGRESVPAAG